MNIAIIVPSFPPDSHIAALRWARLSQELIERGHSIVIVVGEPGGWGNPFKMRQAGESPPDVKQIIRVPWPYSTRIGQILYLAALAVFKVPLRTVKKFCSTKLGKRIDDLDFWLTAKVQRVYGMVFFPCNSVGWGKKAARSLQGWMESGNRIDVIIASYPLLGSLIAAESASQHTGTPWIADFRDPMSSEVLFNPDYCRRIRVIEERLLKSAAQVWAINRQLGDLLATEQPVRVVSQSFLPSGDPPPEPNCDQPTTRIVYTGNVHLKSRYCDFFDGIESVSQSTPTRRIQIDYYGGQFSRIARYHQPLAERGIDLIDHGFVDSKTCFQAQRDADLLVVFGWDGPDHECVYTGKLFDYLATGKPVVAMNYREGALAELIDATGAGVVLDSQQDVAEFFEKLKSDPDGMLKQIHQQRNEDQLLNFSTPRVADQVESLLREIEPAKSKRLAESA